MKRVLLLTLRFYHGRFHGTGDWPPAPARLFQGLIAGCSPAKTLSLGDAFRWLETLSPPDILAPSVRVGQRTTNYLPNNDLDAFQFDIARWSKTKGAKRFAQPNLFDVDIPLLYAWALADDSPHAATLCQIANQLYQLGRGVDMAYARGEILDQAAYHALIANYPGVHYRPGVPATSGGLDCPVPGSFDSLENRFQQQSKRFRVSDDGKTTIFVQPPKALFSAYNYNSAPERFLFELIESFEAGEFAPWQQTAAPRLVERVRDLASDRFVKAMPAKRALIERVFIGRDAKPADIATRIRIFALPSIGHQHADRAIRRILIEIPPNCPLRPDDIEWAFSGLQLSQSADQASGAVISEVRLLRAQANDMLRHYGINAHASRVWRSVTPVALPFVPVAQSQSGTQRFAKNQALSVLVLNALRHADVSAKVVGIRVQKEPFESKGAMAQAFTYGDRFTALNLWHLEIEFATPINGPLVLGDGRYLGLGLLAPLRCATGAIGFSILSGTEVGANPIEMATALRRAVMSRAQAELGRVKNLSSYFTGHSEDGTAMGDGRQRHLAFVCDFPRKRLLIIAPHLLESRLETRFESNAWADLERAIAGMTELRAGASGLLKLQPEFIDLATDPLFAPAITWNSVNNYLPTRHTKKISPEDALMLDVQLELKRRGLPRAEVNVLKAEIGPRKGLVGRLSLQFECAQKGPLLLGKSTHFGGGLFIADSSTHHAYQPPIK